MSIDHSQSVRRMSRSEAEAAAIRIATNLVAAAANERWTFEITGATPCLHDPRPMGKTPSRWLVHTKGSLRQEPDTVIDGANPSVLVDLLAETAQWVEVGSS